MLFPPNILPNPKRFLTTPPPMCSSTAGLSVSTCGTRPAKRNSKIWAKGAPHILRLWWLLIKVFRYRKLSYDNVDLFLLCFPLVRPISLDNIKDKWVGKLKAQAPGVPIMLIGLKMDLREGADWSGESRCQEHLGRLGYAECSAKSWDGAPEIFIEATKFIISPSKKSNFKCGCLLLWWRKFTICCSAELRAKNDPFIYCTWINKFVFCPIIFFALILERRANCFVRVQLRGEITP